MSELTTNTVATKGKGVKAKKEETVEEKCKICCEGYTVSRRKKVTCSHCSESACTSCVKRYLLNTIEDPHCLFCRAHWNREFLDTTLSQHFMSKDYKEHRESILCEREKSKIPETQAIYTGVKTRMDDAANTRKSCCENIARLENELGQLRRKYYEEISKLQKDVSLCDRKMEGYRRVMNGYTDTIPNDEEFQKETTKKVQSLIFPCPKDTCHAFLNENLSCDQCGTKVCKSCHQVKENGMVHQCNENDLATIKQLKKDSKNCPGCSTMIFKIDGCDQMWCTQCHTAFSWKTGEKITRGQIHNPHFYEWRRNNGGLAPGAVDADGCPVNLVDIGSINRAILAITSRPVHRAIWDTHREINEIEAIYINAPVMQYTDANRSLRIQYIKSVITEDQWKQELQRIEKKESRTFETLQVYQMYVSTMKDLFRNILTAKTAEDLDTIKDQMISLMEYVHSNLLKINKRYGSASIPNYALNGKKMKETTAFCINTHRRF